MIEIEKTLRERYTIARLVKTGEKDPFLWIAVAESEQYIDARDAIARTKRVNEQTEIVPPFFTVKVTVTTVVEEISDDESSGDR